RVRLRAAWRGCDGGHVVWCAADGSRDVRWRHGDAGRRRDGRLLSAGASRASDRSGRRVEGRLMSQTMTRRELMTLLAAAALPVSPQAGTPIIRTILRDVSPTEIDGPILIHEHLS